MRHNLKNEDFNMLMGKSELEWLFHKLLDKASDDFSLSVDDMKDAIAEFEREKMHGWRGIGTFYLCWLVSRGNVIAWDELVAAPPHGRYYYRLRIPDELKAKMK